MLTKQQAMELAPGDRVLMTGLRPAVVVKHVIVAGDFEGVVLAYSRWPGSMEFGVRYDEAGEILRAIEGA